MKFSVPEMGVEFQFVKKKSQKVELIDSLTMTLTRQVYQKLKIFPFTCPKQIEI